MGTGIPNDVEYSFAFINKYQWIIDFLWNGIPIIAYWIQLSCTNQTELLYRITEDCIVVFCTIETITNESTFNANVTSGATVIQFLLEIWIFIDYIRDYLRSNEYCLRVNIHEVEVLIVISCGNTCTMVFQFQTILAIPFDRAFNSLSCFSGGNQFQILFKLGVVETSGGFHSWNHGTFWWIVLIWFQGEVDYTWQWTIQWRLVRASVNGFSIAKWQNVVQKTTNHFRRSSPTNWYILFS